MINTKKTLGKLQEEGDMKQEDLNKYLQYKVKITDLDLVFTSLCYKIFFMTLCCELSSRTKLQVQSISCCLPPINQIKLICFIRCKSYQ